MLNVSIQSLEGYKELKVYNAISYFLKKFNSTAKSFSKVNTMVMVIQQFPRLIFELILILLIATIVFFNFDNLVNVSSNTEFLSKIGLLALSSFKLIPSISKIVVALQNIKFNTPSLKILSKEIKLSDDINNESLQKVEFNESLQKVEFKERLELKNVSFMYPNSEMNVLEDINLNIIRGSKIGIMGESGSGKTTLINLIIGLITPTTGKILIDNKNPQIKGNLNWLDKISYVPQKIFMGETSIKENIAFGVSNNLIDQNKIDLSLKYSSLIELVSSLNNGLDFNVGRKGDKLSRPTIKNWYCKSFLQKC